MIGLRRGVVGKTVDPNLKLELKFNSQVFTDVAGTVAAGANDYVRAWRSTVGGHLLTQATDAARPQRVSDGIYFDGGDFVIAPSGTAFSPGALDFSISFWVKTTNTSRFDLFNNLGCGYYIWSSGSTEAFGVGALGTQWAADYKNGAWHFLEYGGTGGNSIYVRRDGVQVATATGTYNLTGAGVLCIGKHYIDGSYFFVGSIADIRFFLGYAPKYSTPPTRSS